MSSPGYGKVAKSSSCSNGRAPDPAWELSRSCALVTPLTIKHHSASENKICIYVTPPSSPALPLPWFQGSMLQTWRNSSGSMVTSKHLLGHDHSACPWGNQRRGWGKSGIGEGCRESYITHNHTLRPGSFEKDAQKPLGTQQGAQACATQLDTHRHWEGGARCPR